MTQYIDQNGCRLAYDITGDGPPVVMIQGVGVHGGGWQPQVGALSQHYRCVTFDNRGMGQSQPAGRGRIAVEQMADDARAIMDAAGIDSAHVIGHSLGGLIAQHLAITHSKRVRSLSLLCTFSRGADATKMSLWMLWVGMRTRIGPRRLRRRAFLQIVMPPDALASHPNHDALAAELQPLFGHDLADQPPIVMKQLSAMRRYDATPRLGELAGIPTLVISARHDRIARPTSGKAIAQGIPGARYVEFEDASHGLPIQHAQRVNALLADHLALSDTAAPAQIVV